MTLKTMQTDEVKRCAAIIKAQGFRVFIADRGTYGFFTDTEGSRLVSFQCDGLRQTCSGNYKTDRPRQTGSGWQIDENFRPELATRYFESMPPQWAVGGAKWRFSTLAEHLATYQSSSKFVEQE